MCILKFNMNIGIHRNTDIRMSHNILKHLLLNSGIRIFILSMSVRFPVSITDCKFGTSVKTSQTHFTFLCEKTFYKQHFKCCSIVVNHNIFPQDCFLIKFYKSVIYTDQGNHIGEKISVPCFVLPEYSDIFLYPYLS